MEKYLGGEELSVDEVKAGIRKATIALLINPVLCGTAFKNKGVQTLLDAVIDYMPSPLDVPPIPGIEPETGAELTRPADDKGPFASLAFKVMTDPFVGQLTFFRTYSGVAESGAHVLNATKGKKERFGRLLKMHANKREEIKQVYSGDIAAAVGLKYTSTGDTLCDPKQPCILEAMEFPEPVIHIAIEPKTKSDQEKMGIALGKLVQEDPSLRVKTDEETGQVIISGMGELHLEIIVDRLKREFKVEANIGAPQVAYRETIRSTVEQESKFIRQSGGRGQYGHVVLRIEPLEAGAGYEFVDKIVGGVIPRQFIPAVDKGIQESMVKGGLAGYPVQDFQITLFDGSHHSVDSSEMAFKIAGSMAFKKAFEAANPVLLEPIVEMEINVPDECVGDVIGDMNQRRGKVLGMDPQGSSQVVRAQVPMSEVLKYAPELRSMTSDRGLFTMEFSHYEEVPSHMTAKLLEELKKAQE